MEKRKEIHNSLFSKLRGKNRRLFIRCIVASLAVIMLVTVSGITSFATEINKAKQEKSRLEQKKAETELKLKELEKEKDDILKYIEKLDIQLSELAQEVDELNGQIQDAESNLEKTKEELEIAKATEEKQYAIMKKRIQYMYENGNVSIFDILAKSENISDMLNQMEYMSKITEYDNRLLVEYTNIKQEIAVKEEQIESQIEELNGLKEELTFEQDTIEQLVADKNEEVAKYNQSISETKEISNEYASKLNEQEELIEQLLEAERRRQEEERKRREEEERRRREEQQKQQNANQSSGSSENSSGGSSSAVSSTGFIWPVPSSTRITSTFGYRNQPTAGASTYHKGIDIGASTGSKIVAAASGTVVTASYSVSAGNYIMISHGNGLYTVYMHCSQLLVSVGDNVNQGQNIALVGSTGVSTGPHLHFGVYVNGEYVDPLKYVSY